MTDVANAEHVVDQVVPFFRVADLRASLRFYVDGLGFRMTNKWVDKGVLRWCWLQHGGAAIMLQESSDPQAPDAIPGAGVSLCFICKDALTFYSTVVARGVDASVPFVGNSMWVTTMTDPDGYRLEFESPTDVPEETVHRPSL